MMQSVCIFSGSSPGARPEYAVAARALGREAVTRGMRVVYGGASVGLMGAVADAVLEAGGEVVGVMPQSLVAKEIAHARLSELHVTGSMHARKALMAELSDGFVALPGGFGTLDELAEMITWSQLGVHSKPKPCGLLDVAGYYGPLLAFVDHAVEERFVPSAQRDLVLVDTDPRRLLDAMSEWKPSHTEKWLDREGPANP